MNMPPVRSHRALHSEGDLAWCFAFAILRFLALSLNLCFVSQVPWDKGVCAWAEEMCTTCSPPWFLCDVPEAQIPGGPTTHGVLHVHNRLIGGSLYVRVCLDIKIFGPFSPLSIFKMLLYFETKYCLLESRSHPDFLFFGTNFYLTWMPKGLFSL